MNTSTCPHCGVELGPFIDAEACPYCLQKLASGTKTSLPRWAKQPQLVKPRPIRFAFKATTFSLELRGEHRP